MSPERSMARFFVYPQTLTPLVCFDATGTLDKACIELNSSSTVEVVVTASRALSLSLE